MRTTPRRWSRRTCRRERGSPSARSRGGNPCFPHVPPSSSVCGGTSRFPHTPSTRSLGGRPMSGVGLVAALDAQTVADAVGLGAVYALMAVGIGLVFGVLRLVNFAYGQLVMAGAYTLAFTSAWPVGARLAACFVVVVAFSLVMERTVFKPLRFSSPAVMLVTTFALAFMLQAIALLVDVRDGTIGEAAAPLRRPP